MSDPIHHYGSKLNAILRPSITSYLVFGLVPMSAFVISFLAFTLGEIKDGFGFPMFLLLVSFGVVISIARFRITIHGDMLAYRSLFHADRGLRLSEIARARVDVRIFNRTNREYFTFAPPFALVVEPYPEVKDEPLIINLRIFSRKDLAQLFDFFGGKLVNDK